MLCTICKKEKANIHIQEITDKGKISLHLCTNCAIAKGIINHNNHEIDISNMIGELSTNLADQLKNNFFHKTDQSNLPSQCPACGMNAEKIKNEGRLGCPQCYKTFEKFIIPIIKSMHHSLQHKGKIGTITDNTQILEQKQKQKSLEKLQLQLEHAIKNEAYEKAAKIRDKISIIIKNIGGGKYD